MYYTAPTLAVTTSPISVDIINVEPHDAFSIVCTATAPDIVIVPKSIEWERMQDTSTASEALTDNGDTVTIVDANLDSPTSTSTLMVTENTAGNYIYTCTSTLQILPEGLVVNDTSSVTVRG